MQILHKGGNCAALFMQLCRKDGMMKFNEMTIEQLKAYRASVEAYGTASELYEVAERIRELEGGNKDE